MTFENLPALDYNRGMATELKMPQLSDTMYDGKIVSWKKKEGDKVSRGEALAEVETDKANLEIESFSQGVLLKILTPAGSKAKVGDAIAVIGNPGEQVATPAANSPTPQKAAPAPEAKREEAPPSVEPKVSASTNGTHSYQKDSPSFDSKTNSDRIKVSPLARKIAEQNNVDLSSVTGSGPQGRIVRKDIEAAAQSGPAHQTAATRTQEQDRSTRPSSPSSEPIPAGGRSSPLSKMRETIARRMQESVTQAPHFYVTAAIDMDQAQQLREILKQQPEYKGISVNHLVIKAAAYALRHEPRVNRAIKNGAVYEPDSINIGIITAVEDGLLIPVVRAVDTLSLRDVVFEARAGIERARAGRPSSSDLTGGTFSISNMGMFDVENFTAIINPGQGAVLAVSATQQVPLVRNGQVVVGSQMKVTLSVDHRVIDGVMGAQFLKFFKQALENPALLMCPL